jgi:streptogramin lyase
MTTGFTGGGVTGVSFGLAIDAHDSAWVDSYAGEAIAHFDPSGKPLSPPDGYNLNGKLGEMQGIIVTPNGDIWAVDQGKSQVVHLPKADPDNGRIYCQNTSKDPMRNPCGLFAPFHLAIDQQDRIWITNNIGNSVIRFPVSDPTKVEKFKVGFGGSGLAIDSLGNVWVANRFGNSTRARLKLYQMMAAYSVRGERPRLKFWYIACPLRSLASGRVAASRYCVRMALRRLSHRFSAKGWRGPGLSRWMGMTTSGCPISFPTRPASYNCAVFGPRTARRA